MDCYSTLGMRKYSYRMKTLFLSFGDGSPQMIEAANRIGEQAISMKTFSQVTILNNETLLEIIPTYENTLKNMKQLDADPLYYRAIKTYLIDWGLRGYFGKFDVIMYCDAGSEFVDNFFSRKKLKKLLNQAYCLGGVAQHLNVKEMQFTKKKLFEYLGCSTDERNSLQIQATWSMWKNSDDNRKIVKQWVELSSAELDLWQNPIGTEEEFCDFIEHRRDQSIFSILWKRSGNYSFPELRDFRTILSASFPIQNRRNRTGQTQVSKVSNSWIAGLVSLTYKTYYPKIKNFWLIGKRLAIRT